MDDDGYPKEDALENLLAADDGCLRLPNCAVIDKEDKRSFVWKTQHYKTLDEVDCKLIEGIGHPFNGTMLHRRIIERVGVPKPKYFLWGDERNIITGSPAVMKYPFVRFRAASTITHQPLFQ
ncbi:MAG: hypothetical protein IPL50_12150 [Chitinophagaceae bacterium]|nr:hypothetical protein [Chitinophagaceae bacterium]